jgi:hypothetical protein
MNFRIQPQLRHLVVCVRGDERSPDYTLTLAPPRLSADYLVSNRRAGRFRFGQALGWGLELGSHLAPPRTEKLKSIIPRKPEVLTRSPPSQTKSPSAKVWILKIHDWRLDRN